MVDVWLTFRKEMQKWIRKIGKKNVVYSHTDCAFTPLESVPDMPGYTVALKHKFKWIAIFNQIRYVGMTDEGKFHKTHFDRRMNLKLFDYLDRAIEAKLKDRPLAFLRNPVSPLKLEELPEDAFKIVVFKKDDTCYNIEYLILWPKLEYGLNTVYLAKRGLTSDSKRICYRRYNKYMDYYMRLWRLK